MDAITRAEARAAGATYYFTAKPCKNGHLTARLASSGVCTECGRKDSQHWLSKPGNSERKRSRMQEWRRRNPDRVLANSYRWRGVAPAAAAAAWASHDGRCACCGRDAPGSKTGWHLDHDHATGKVRGIVCHKCNVMLGHAEDSSDRLRLGIEYLAKFGSK